MQTPSSIFITGTDTGIGKTVVSSIIVEALKADYWKPVQSGDLHDTDTDTVRRYTNDKFVYHPEGIRLKKPASPHESAAEEGIRIDPDSLNLPYTENCLVIEGAGGLMVPLNEEDLLVDWVAEKQLSTILVSGNKLGSINHTLLSIEALMNRNIEILGLIFNGPATPGSESFINTYAGLPVLGRVDQHEEWSVELTAKYALQFASNLT
jgi:dethiobiotin synthetase